MCGKVTAVVEEGLACHGVLLLSVTKGRDDVVFLVLKGHGIAAL